MQEIYDRAKNIRVAAFDVDGVLTDGTLYFADSGEELKAFNVRDGHGMKMLKDSGVALAIITSRSSRSLEARARNLGIDLLFQGAADKLAAESVEIMERFKVNQMLVVGPDQKLLGALNMHDLFRAKVI